LNLKEEISDGVKININQIPVHGLIVEEVISAGELDLETGEVKYRQPVKVRASIFRITNAVDADLSVTATAYGVCSRCLDEAKIEIKKEFKLSYQVSGSNQIIDMDPDIREEILLEYAINPVCSPGCKGLCPRCGKNLNEGECNCKVKS
jgi:uncharacterized protein